MDIQTLKAANKLQRQIDELTSHFNQLNGLKSNLNTSEISLNIPYNGIKFIFQEEFMLVSIEKNVDIYLNSVSKKIELLEISLAKL